MSSATEASNPNDRQVGGTHYKTGGMEHWDLFGEEYHLGCASKYVSRHMDKNGRQDLEKAVHFCEKAMTLIGNRSLTNTVETHLMLEWAAGTSMGGAEISICHAIMCDVNLPSAIRQLRRLIEEKYPAAVPQEESRPGTPEDGGHHARQPVEDCDGELIQAWGADSILAGILPPSLSTHEWQHHCSLNVQEKYAYDVSAARYLIKDEYRRLTYNCKARD